MSKIIKLNVQNIKRIKAVEIVVDGKNFVEITGRNAAGKSSVMDSIAMALGGAKLCPDKPIRQGQDFAQIMIELDDVIVRRLFYKGGDSKLSVTSKEGFTHKSPQEYLNKLIGTLSFDPLVFTTLDKAKRVSLFKKLSGIDTAKLDEEYQNLYAKRRDANTIAKRAQIEFDAVSEHSKPVEVPNVSELQKKLDESYKVNNLIENLRSQLITIDSDREEFMRLLKDFEQKIVCLETKKQTVMAEIDSMAACDKIPFYTSQINEAQDMIVKKIKHEDHLKYKSILGDANKVCESLQHGIDKIIAEIAELMASKKLPVKNLELRDDDLYFNSVPFDQLSQAEKLRVAVSMAISEKPELKIIRIMDGSLLDSNSMQILSEMAHANDFQIFIETVSDEKSSNESIFIEDGEVV